MPIITEKVLEATGAKLLQHMKDYKDQIEEAYCKLEEGALTVDLKAKFAAEGLNAVKVGTSISFIADKIKDCGTVRVDERQKPLFEDGKPNRLREILFRNFDELRIALLAMSGRVWHGYFYTNPKGGLLFKRF